MRCENQAFAHRNSYMDSRHRYSYASWHRWNKVALQNRHATIPTGGNLTQLQRALIDAIYTKSKYIQSFNRSDISFLTIYLRRGSVGGRCTKREIEFQWHVMDVRGRDKDDQPDIFTPQPRNSIESKIHITPGQLGAHLPLVNMTIL